MSRTDPEALFRLAAAADWSEAIGRLSQAPLPEGAVSGHAARVVADGLRAAADGLETGDLERFLLLGRAGRLPMTRQDEAAVVERLLGRLRDDPARALSIARFRPDLPACVAVIQQHGIPERSRIGDSGLDATTAELRHGTVDAGRSIFRSPAEEAFFEAARRVYPRDLVCPNVALHAALDFDMLRARLSAREKRIFFTALVDCVVFGAADRFRPRGFFEIDSASHDDHRRGERDALKDRIVALAGHRLIRVRVGGEDATADGFERLLRGLPDRPAPVY